MLGCAKCEEGTWEKGRIPTARKVVVLRYEEVVLDPATTLERLCSFVGLRPFRSSVAIEPGVNDSYVQEWKRERDPFSQGGLLDVEALRGRFRSRVEAFGYELPANHFSEADPP